MGGKQITSKWLEIIKIDINENIIYVKGSVPGARNGVLYLISEAEFKLPVKEEQKKEEKPVEDKPAEEVKEEAKEVKEEPKEVKKEEAPAEDKKEVKKEDK